MTGPDHHAEMEAHYAAMRDGSAARRDILRDAMARYRSAQDIGAPEFACVTAAVDPILADAGWQAMNTAPKAAEPILLMPGYGIYRSVTIAPVVGHWCEHADGWVSWETGRAIERKPLAWMPIPVLYESEGATL